MLVATISSAAETYDGTVFLNLARQSVDVVRLHQIVSQSELNQDRTLNHLSLTLRSSPAHFLLGDGTTSSGGISRFLFSIGGGFGKPSSGVSGAAGIDIDQAYTSKFPNMFQRGGPDANWIQALLYARASAYGFSLNLGFLVSEAKGIDNYGQFIGAVAPTYRPGTPDEVESGSSRTSTAFVLSLRQKEGVGFGFSYADLLSHLPDGRTELKKGLATLRTQIAPERLLPKEIGVLTLGLDRLAGELDYYLDQYKAARDAISSASPAGLPAYLPTPPPIWELPFGMENIAGIGLRGELVPQVSPSAKFRMAEVAWTTAGLGEETPFIGSVRIATFSRNGTFQPGLDLSAGVRVRQVYSSWVVSYSYNSPDTTTFLPIPNAHVIGFQYVLGAPESAPSVVPTVVHGGKGGK